MGERAIDSGAPRSKLPVVALSRQALMLPYARAGALLRFAIVPFAVVTASIIAFHALSPGMSSPYDLMRRSLVTSPVIAIVLFEFVLPSYAVTVTRCVLDGAAGITGRSSFEYSATEFRYAVAALLTTLALVGTATVMAATIYGFAMVSHGNRSVAILMLSPILPALAFVVVRLTLLFPAIAANRAASVRMAWAETRGSFWRLSAIWLLTTVPYLAAALVLQIVATNLHELISKVLFASILSALVVASWTTTLAWQALAFVRCGAERTAALASRAHSV